MKLEEIGPNLLLHESAFRALILDVVFVGPQAPLAQCPYWGHVYGVPVAAMKDCGPEGYAPSSSSGGGPLPSLPPHQPWTEQGCL